MAAAITRFITRLLAAVGTTRTVEKETESKGLGRIAGIVTYLSLDTLDRPDTRSWQSLPGEIRLLRTTLQPGTYDVTVRVRNRTENLNVKIHPDRLNLINVSRLR